MILIYQRARINDEAANSLSNSNQDRSIFYPYPVPNLSVSSGDTLNIVDLSANGRFQDLTSPKILAEDLIKNMKLPKSVKYINVLVSDVYPEHRLGIFCSKLADALSDYNDDISVRCFTASKNEVVFVCPPSKLKTNWEIYKLSLNAFEKSKLKFGNYFYKSSNYSLEGIEHKKLANFTKLANNPNKELIWQGKNISQYLIEKGKTYNDKDLDSFYSLYEI